jgi:hypothetical protein
VAGAAVLATWRVTRLREFAKAEPKANDLLTTAREYGGEVIGSALGGVSHTIGVPDPACREVVQINSSLPPTL